MEPIKETEKKQRQNYYQKNKEKMNRIARERYHQKKQNDPEFYNSMLEKNQKAYYKKNHRLLTPEEEEEYFKKIRKDVARIREETPPDDISNYFTYEQIHEMFFTV